MLILLYGITAFVYLLLAGVAFRGNIALEKNGSLKTLGLLFAVLLHGFLLHETIFVVRDSTMVMQFGFAPALSTMFWLGAAIYLIEGLFFSIEGLAAIIFPLTAIAVVLPLFFPSYQSVTYIHNPLFKAHFIIAFLSYGLFAIAAMHAVLMVIAEQRLHRAIVSNNDSVGLNGFVYRLIDRLPPLLTLERLLFRMIFVGFVLLSLTLITGLVFSEQLFGRAFRFDHKTVFAILSWVIFGLLILGRQFYGWRGQLALRWTFSGFIALLLAYIGSRFVLEVILHRV